MRGIHHVEISNRDAKFKFDLCRNITIVRGDSGTGKTTLFEMIADHTRLKEASGINISCDKACVALTDIDWKNQLRNTADSIVFLDEGAEYMRTPAFAEIIKHTDNYYVFFTREDLHALPYSVEEIYEIKASGKYHSFKKIYKSKRHDYYKGRAQKRVQYEIVLTEDSGAGLQLYQHYFQDSGVQCVSSESNSAIFNWLNEHKDQQVLVIADGAAFGAEIDRVLKLQGSAHFRLCLPESFEWLILKSGLIRAENIADVLENSSKYIESAEYFSWERFFTAYLINATVQTPFRYEKGELNPAYINGQNAKKIIAEILPAE